MDFGESPEDTAKRELLEETGLLATYIQPYKHHPYGNTHFEKTNRQYITLYFEAAVEGVPEVKEPDKCERWEWFPPDELPKPLFDPIEEDKLNLAGKDLAPLALKVEFLTIPDQRLVLQFNQTLRWFAMELEEVRDLARTLTAYADQIDGTEPD